MNKTQIIQTTPQDLVELINQGVKTQLENFKKDFISQKTCEELLTREAAYTLLSINSSTLSAWTKKGKLIAYGIGGRKYYKRSEIIEALEPVLVK